MKPRKAAKREKIFIFCDFYERVNINGSTNPTATATGTTPTAAGGAITRTNSALSPSARSKRVYLFE
jgi:hypothetical protein